MTSHDAHGMIRRLTHQRDDLRRQLDGMEEGRFAAPFGVSLPLICVDCDAEVVAITSGLTLKAVADALHEHQASHNARDGSS